MALQAKWVLFRELGAPNLDPPVAELEGDILDVVNRTGVGPIRMGGETTCVAVHVETYTCHIGALPICVNVECHAHRHTPKRCAECGHSTCRSNMKWWRPSRCAS